MPLGHDHSTEEAPQDPGDRLVAVAALLVMFLIALALVSLGWMGRWLLGK